MESYARYIKNASVFALYFDNPLTCIFLLYQYQLDNGGQIFNWYLTPSQPGFTFGEM